MALQTSCPYRDRLRELHDKDFGAEEQADLVGHLDSCECCQHSLEEMAAAGDSSWQHACRHVDKDQPSATSAYWPALQALEQEVILQGDIPVPPGSSLVIQGDSPAPPEDTRPPVTLDFLAPADEEGYCGKLGHFNVVGIIGRGGNGCRPQGVRPLFAALCRAEGAGPRAGE